MWKGSLSVLRKAGLILFGNLFRNVLLFVCILLADGGVNNTVGVVSLLDKWRTYKPPSCQWG